MRARLSDWLDERTGYREVLAEWRRPVAGGASFAHTLGFLFGFLLVIEALSGALLALYYAPSTSAAWASVAYIEDQVPLGAVVRGVHRWGMSAVVIVAGLHLVVTALRGGYRRPREVQWWIGLGLIGVITLYSVTGFVLRWDQYGYWATKVELAYVNDAPGPGRQLVQAVQGGNEFGNLTLTRFYALHAVVLPVVTLLLAWAFRAQTRRHGVQPTHGPARPAWPYQSLRNWVVAALALIALVAWSHHAGGAGLDGPADPTAAYDARPQWYFRPLFALVNTFGSLRTFIALGLPLVVFGVLAAVPLFDGRPGRVTRHYAVLAVLFVGLLGAIGVSMQSYAKDDDDQELQRRSRRFAREATLARKLAKANGVPAPGGLAVYTTPRFYVARKLWASECASCHEGDDRKAPVLGPGLASRAHIRSLLVDASAPEHYGLVKKIVDDENAMPKTEATGADLDALVELIYAETGADDVDAAKVEQGKPLFDDGPCADCHNRTGTDASTGPNLAGYGSRRFYEAVLRDSGSPHLFGKLDDMPAYEDDLEPNQLRAMADYLVWLRKATPADLEALKHP
jgi:ubiquinol-cytochrome c reductase cytochrome b subunit